MNEPYDYNGAKQAAQLLLDLQKEGFDNPAFVILHHFSVERRPTIKAFLDHCSKVDSFTHGGNPDTHRRLKLVWDAYRGAGFTGTSELFVHLAHAAVVEVPIER